MFTRSIFVIALGAMFVVSASAQDDTKSHKKSTDSSSAIWVELVKLPSGTIFTMTEAEAQARGDDAKDTWPILDSKTKRPTGIRTSFPRYLNVDGHQVKVEGFGDKNPKQNLPHLMFRLPSATSDHVYKLKEKRFVALSDGSHWKFRGLEFKRFPKAGKIELPINAEFEPDSIIGSDTRVCLRKNKDAPCVENSNIKAGEYLLDYRQGNLNPGQLKQKCNYTYDRCSESQKAGYPEDEYRERCHDRQVTVRCISVDGTTQFVLEEKYILESVQICTKTYVPAQVDPVFNCPAVTVGSTFKVEQSRQYIFSRPLPK